MVQQLISAAKQGDLPAFNELVRQYQDYIYTVTYRIMGDPASADDMTQETFITAYKKISQFKEGNFKGWLGRIATNNCYDELRRLKRRPADSLEDRSTDEDADARLTSRDESPEQYAQRGELQSAIADCFGQLSDAHRMVVMMCDVQAYAYDEIAETAKVSLGTVKSRISRARSLLRDCLRTKGELLPAKYRSNSNND